MMSANHYPRIIRCYVCGSDVSTTAARSKCEDCKIEERKAAARRRYNRDHTPPPVVIIYDPIPVDLGGFRQGAGMTNEELHTGMNMRSFKPGMIVAVHGNKRVIRQRGQKQELEAIYD